MCIRDRRSRGTKGRLGALGAAAKAAADQAWTGLTRRSRGAKGRLGALGAAARLPRTTRRPRAYRGPSSCLRGRPGARPGLEERYDCYPARVIEEPHSQPCAAASAARPSVRDGLLITLRCSKCRTRPRHALWVSHRSAARSTTLSSSGSSRSTRCSAWMTVSRFDHSRGVMVVTFLQSRPCAGTPAETNRGTSVSARSTRGARQPRCCAE